MTHRYIREKDDNSEDTTMQEGGTSAIDESKETNEGESKGEAREKEKVEEGDKGGDGNNAKNESNTDQVS